MRTQMGLVAVLLFGAACVASADEVSFGGGGGGRDSATSGGSGGQGGDVSLGGAPGCTPGLETDADGDGFTVAEGDCDDCDPNVNPGALELPTEGTNTPADEDCDGAIDDLPLCDGGLAVDDTDPLDAARAIDLCRVVPPGDEGWGVLDAKYVRASGEPAPPGLRAGLLSAFGANVLPRLGTRMLALSSGTARVPGQPDACGTEACGALDLGTAPDGFPQDVPSCPGDKKIYNDVGLELAIRAPTNAKGYGFQFRFYSFEFPTWICSAYNDQFIALAHPAPPGAKNGNISFDAKGNPVSVNLAFVDTCDALDAGCWAKFCSGTCPKMPEPYCGAGTNDLVGTGFLEWQALDVCATAGATDWLETTAPVEGGSTMSIRFAIWDTGDAFLDSTVVIDGFRWIAKPVDVSTAPVPK